MKINNNNKNNNIAFNTLFWLIIIIEAKVLVKILDRIKDSNVKNIIGN